jgi:dimeric dUTPase (all-alpha-NTP-PPase superfamily)
MNLSKLVEIQKGLMDRIEEKHPAKSNENRFYKRLLALLVEVGECANNWRGFKFWSNDQVPRTTEICKLCDGAGYLQYETECPSCEGKGDVNANPLLEEYVDILHFILELGIVLDVLYSFDDIKIYKSNNIEHQFIKLYREITNLWLEPEFYSEVLNTYIGLGEILGFTWDQIEQAYLEKNAVNHQRQADGY